MKLAEFKTIELSQKEIKTIDGGYWGYVVKGAKWLARTYIGNEIKKGFVAGMERDCSTVCTR
ncbi:hypothetical protein [Salegentibacter maritimus]|uniref:Bacteriocin-type signal sequence-containing protein n=1 Tax=Salegentibacter maritimus TaxID=2794347 RepID=A0ABS0TJJ7_9FLAO|nr:hypothetical protein [Salegentibacter maritimus]MBI6121193.1 hypothetical protein [Salegentibacter maritimus]